jgi:hypothetical protein
MKFIDPNVSFTGFHFLKTVYTQFHLDETSLFLFFINSLHVIKRYYVTPHLLKIKFPLGVA